MELACMEICNGRNRLTFTMGFSDMEIIILHETLLKRILRELFLEIGNYSGF
jgi:hypothetical protein